MNDQSRRQFLRSSAVAVGVMGAGLAQQRGAAQQTGEIPGYAEWIPDGDSVLNNAGEIDIGTYTVTEQVEQFGEVSASTNPPLQFEPFVYTASMLNLWQALGVTSLAEPVLGPLASMSDPTNAEPTGVPAERHTLIGRTSVYTGSFDTDAIAQAVEDSDATETQYDGVYEYPNTAVIAWGDGYLLQGDTQSTEQVVAIRNTGDGSRSPRYESSTQLRDLLTAVDHTGQVILRHSSDGTLNTGAYTEQLDHSPIEGASGYIGTLRYDLDATEFDGTTVIRYPDEGSIDTDRISQMVTDELRSEITRDGRTVRVTASYDRGAVGFDPNSSQDGSDGEDGSDSENSTDSDGMDGNNSASNDTDGSESSDGSGPGFGVATALSTIGGAGYLLSRRLDGDAE
ncbi:twin-arginine translocation signal domain-containing protein [Halovenus sp. WSH3]|uniref:Twin-arginine translocation signal domain-containing protein n=1 Tax=Halovenus carboxidivorans TaxID=2692199 RepID=A0A6B0TAI6_9EURY|nr:twin-arginine translocation signal domain-containing protein [Halovenus carboxidivorans]MXR51890.1 twin-arginine translocation signal domain-containing protein [Halovenus carboxidivorans]